MRTAIFEDGKHEYDFEQIDDKYTLYYANNRDWTNPGEVAFQIEDTGNEVKFKDIVLDYSEISQLYTILKFYLAGIKIQKANLQEI